MGGGACRWEGPVHGGAGLAGGRDRCMGGGACRWEGQPTEKVVALVLRCGSSPSFYNI